MAADNKPLAIMAADVKAQASVLRKNASDYPNALNLNRHESKCQNVMCHPMKTATIMINKPNK